VIGGGNTPSSVAQARPSDLPRALYLDSSALVKLVRSEPESEALLQCLAAWPHRVSSALVRVEVPRATARVARDNERVIRESVRLVAGLMLVPVSDAILEAAASLPPPELRTLDAIHLASALSLGSVLGALVSYDDRLSTAARTAGMHVLSPA